MRIISESRNRNVPALDGSDGEANVAPDVRDIADELPAVQDMARRALEARSLFGQRGNHGQRLDRNVVRTENRVIPQLMLPTVDRQTAESESGRKNRGNANAGDKRESDEQSWQDAKPIKTRQPLGTEVPVGTRKCHQIRSCQLILHGHKREKLLTETGSTTPLTLAFSIRAVASGQPFVGTDLCVVRIIS